MLKKLSFTINQAMTFAILATVFLCSVDIFNKYQICIYIALIIFILTPNRRLKIDFNFAILFLFSLTLITFNENYQSGITNIIMAFNYPIGYLIGTSLFITDSKDTLNKSENDVKSIIYTVAIGTFIHYFLNMLVNLSSTHREVIDFWSRKEISATGQAAYACLVIGVIAASLFSDTTKKKKFWSVVVLIIVVLYNLILSGRTLFVLITIALLVAYLFKSYMKKINIIKTCVALILFIAILIILYNVNIFNVKSTFENSNFYNRFFEGEYTQEIDEDTRSANKIYYITHLGDSFFGGGHLRAAYGHSAHDLYLDTYDESGIFAALFIVIYVISSLTRVIKCLRNKLISLETKQLVLGTYLITNIMFFMEPIMRGAPWLLFSYCLIDGAVSHLLNRSAYNTSSLQ